MKKVSDYVFDYLSFKGIDTIFSVSGGAAAHLLNSVAERNFTYICNHHEQACAMAAEGYGRIANKPACVLITNGPGSTNAITGVVGAYQDSIPMIVISGQSSTKLCLGNLENIKLRQLGVQECDTISMVKGITKYSVQITDPNTVPYHIATAYHEATTGRRGPVWLDIPIDVQSSFIEPIDHIISSNTPEDRKYNFDQIIDLISKSKKPIIIAGNGIHLSECEDYFLSLKNKLQIPIVSTWTSKDLLSNDDPLFLGNFGLFGERAGNFAVQNADLLLILGSRLSVPNIGYETNLFSTKSIKVMVDIDSNELIKPTIKIDYPIVEDLKNFIPELVNELNKKLDLPRWTGWIEKTQSWREKYPSCLPEYRTNKKKINSFYFTEVFSAMLKDKTVIVTDIGAFAYSVMQSIKMNGKNRLFTSGAFGSMGFGLPGAIGAYFASPSKDIVLIVGDGGFQMNIQELQTIVHNKIPIKIFVLNNNGYLAISLMQDNLFKSNYIGSNPSSGVSSPDFTKIGNAYGLKTFRFINNNELENNLKNVLQEDGPVLCEIMMVENQLIIPRVQTLRDKNGKLISGSIDNMFPYLSEEEMKNITQD